MLPQICHISSSSFNFTPYLSFNPYCPFSSYLLCKALCCAKSSAAAQQTPTLCRAPPTLGSMKSVSRWKWRKTVLLNSWMLLLPVALFCRRWVAKRKREREKSCTFCQYDHSCYFCCNHYLSSPFCHSSHVSFSLPFTPCHVSHTRRPALRSPPSKPACAPWRCGAAHARRAALSCCPP